MPYIEYGAVGPMNASPKMTRSHNERTRLNPPSAAETSLVVELIICCVEFPIIAIPRSRSYQPGYARFQRADSKRRPLIAADHLHNSARWKRAYPDSSLLSARF